MFNVGPCPIHIGWPKCLLDAESHQALENWHYSQGVTESTLSTPGHLALDADGAEIREMEVLQFGESVFLWPIGGRIPNLYSRSQKRVLRRLGVRVDPDATQLYNARSRPDPNSSQS